MIKAVVFDLGGVLIENPVRNIFGEIARMIGVAPSDCRDAFGPILHSFDRGDMTPKEFFDKGLSKLGLKNNLPPDTFYDLFARFYNPDKEMFSLVLNLKKKGCKLGLLSNINVSGIKYLKNDVAPEYDFFDAKVLSAEENISKPEQRIFELIIERIGVKPEEAVFIDDLQVNCDGAVNYGMHAIRFLNVEELKEAFKKLGLFGDAKK